MLFLIAAAAVFVVFETVYETVFAAVFVAVFVD